jgi:uncharacterized protein YndB with AHSA1/START domain
VAPIMAEVNVSRPPREVFAYATDPSRFAEWQSGVVSGHIEGDGPTRVGSRCVMTRRVGGAILLPLVIRQARKEVPRSCKNLKRRLETSP